MIRVWSRSCDYCGTVALIYRHVSSRAPRSVFCSSCDAEHPKIGVVTPLHKDWLGVASPLYANWLGGWVERFG